MTPRKKKSTKSACGMTGAEAQAAYEKSLAAEEAVAAKAKDLAEHVAGCGPCSSALHALELQGDAVSALSQQPRDGAAGTAVEGILRIAAISGTGKLADLAYELAKACLIRLPNLERRVRRVVEPRAAKIVARELRAVNHRRGLVATPVGLRGIPADAPAEPYALSAATSCLKILKEVEGSSPRQVLGTAMVHIFEQRPERAEVLLRELLAKPLSPQIELYARINLMLALNRQAKYADAVAIVDDAYQADSNNWEALFNLAVAHAHLGQVRPFKDVARRLGRLANNTDNSGLSTLVQFEIPNFATVLGIDSIEVERAFGRHRSTRSR